MTNPEIVSLSCICKKTNSDWDNDFTEIAIPIASNCSILDLRLHDLRSIDLSPLTKLQHLSEIHLGYNLLREIDLDPLAELQDLRVLDLGTVSDSRYPGNEITRIDLRPLSDCHQLNALNLSGNNLAMCDLEPLSSCKKLVTLDLCNNPLRQLDLSPLDDLPNLKRVSVKNCQLESVILPATQSLQELQLQQNRLTHLDFSPLARCEELTTLKLLPNRFRSLDLSPLRNCTHLHFAEDRCAIQELMLNHLGLTAFAGFDGDLLCLMRPLKMVDATYIVDSLIKEIEEQLCNGGPTVFFDIERILETPAAGLVPLIVERRQIEIEELVIYLGNDEVDLRPLWLTEYGFRVLSHFGMDLFCNIDEFTKIQMAFHSLGFEIPTTRILEDRRYSVHASESMREFVFRHARTYRRRELQLQFN